MAGGDDLEDDFIPDDNIIIASEDEQSVDKNENGAEEVSEDTNATTKDAQTASKKRKRREKEKRAKKRKLVAEKGDEDVEPSVACSPPDAIARYLSLAQVEAYSNLSVLELEDLAIPVSCIVDTMSYTEPRVLDGIGNFINGIPRLMLRLSQRPRNNGAPTLIFVAGAALRVADITRVFKNFRGDKGGDVAKLFAKHFKLQDHIAYLKRTKVGVAVGTPGRLGQLLETEALSLSALTHIFIDATHRDAKKRSMIDIPETREELFRGVLGRENIRKGLNLGKIQLVLF